ncbi:hypothetical protein CYMTET_28301 [Cymbomonas tetramitiformis]|uniref:OTU domain-containing protein n=1 Tax=Cymbomonas tetramitiformis TaxID=36881 RepID=A0AAE0FPM0_9CHLO|nr:hypothetical protein CYMTET_28301 [Cymbomonas tetramitiformis]
MTRPSSAGRTYMVYGSDGVEHHLQGFYRDTQQPMVLDIATTEPLGEYKAAWECRTYTSPYGKVTTDQMQMPAARRRLTEAQPAREQGFASMQEVAEYLAKDGLKLRDVTADGDCWLRAICPYVDGMTKLTRKGLNYHVVKMRSALVDYQREYKHLFPWLSETAPEALSLKRRKQAHDTESLLVLAAMVGRVIQCYRILPPVDAKAAFPHTGVTMSAAVAPFSMVHLCPPNGVELISTVPIRVLHLPPGDGYPGHFMRIAPMAELEAEDRGEAELLQRARRAEEKAKGKKTKGARVQGKGCEGNTA